MVLVPNLLEARAALDLDTSRRRRHDHRLLPRQGDPLGSLISIIVNGPPDDTTSTTSRTTSTTSRTTSTPTNTRTTTSTTSSTTSSRSSTRSADVVTSPPPHSTSTVTSTSTQSLSTGNADASLTDGSKPKSGLPSVVVGVIVAASVIFGLIFIALIVRKFFQMRRRRRRGTWMSGVTPFEPPLQEKALPPPPPPKGPMADSLNRPYPSYPPTAVTFGNNGPYSPAVPSSAGYPAPYSYGGATAGIPTTTAGMFNKTAYTPNDLAGPIVITPPTPSTAPAGTISVVKRTFVPSLPDELSIANGDQVRVLSVYDDGWALCEKLVGGEKGVVPQECLESVTSSSSNSNAPKQQNAGSEDTRLNRASSLRRGQDQTY